MQKPIRIFRLPIGFVIDEDGKFLFLKRKDRQSREPVKGGIEFKETPKEAILRELFEETGLKTDDILSFEDYGEKKELVEKEHEIVDIHRYIFFIRIKGKSPVVKINHIQEGGEDHEDYGWFTLEELKTMNLDVYTEFIISEIVNFQKREAANKSYS